MPPKILFKIGGGACILAAIVYLLSLYWFTTRIFEPVDMLITLEQGKIQTGMFKINLRETYYVNVVLDPSIDDYHEDRCNYKKVFASEWKLYRQVGSDPRNAQLLVSWEDNDPQRSHVGDFAVGPGSYQLEWQGPAGAGLFVNFKGERTVIVEKNPWAETMAVYIDGKQRFFVNGKQVAREELRSKLEEELLRRGVWVVYFEADGDCSYMNAVYAMDTIHGLGAKMIWITPKTRQGWKQRAVTETSDSRTTHIP